MTCVHANGDVVCSIVDGRGDFVLGNVHEQSLPDIFAGPRARRLRSLVLSTRDSYCRAIGRRCPLKSLDADEAVAPEIRFLALEPTSACDLRCLTCPVRDFRRDVTWRNALADGGPRFLLWDGLRRSKQHLAEGAKALFPALRRRPEALGRMGALLLRGRIPRSRNGTLPLDVLKRVVSEAGALVERVDMFSYGEPLLYRDLVDALRHIRASLPRAEVAISTSGTQARAPLVETLVEESLVDWLIFSIDGSDAETYRRYRVGADFDTVLANMTRALQLSRGTKVRVVWQYVVFRWNDGDAQLRRAIAMSNELDVPLWFDFAHTWGRSRRVPEHLRYLTPHLKPFTALPGEPRQGGW
jgi:pyruvate-formate lyase-activating enzyme